MYKFGIAVFEKYDQLDSSYLGSSVCNSRLNPGFSTEYIGMESLPIQYVTASVPFFPFLSYLWLFCTVSVSVGWLASIGPFCTGGLPPPFIAVFTSSGAWNGKFSSGRASLKYCLAWP